jgi:hypothetical protein
MTSDDIPIILHGGDNGELHHHFKGDKDNIFDKTYAEILEYDLAEGEKIPTLE